MMDEQDRKLMERVEYALGGLSDDDRRRIEAEMATNAGLRSEIEFIRSVVNAIGTPDGQASDGSLARLRRVGEAPTHRLPQGFEDAQGFVACLIEDSRETLATGFRGEATAYQLTFDVGFAEIHLHVTSDSTGACLIRGQVDVFDEVDGDPIAVTFRRTGRDESINAAVDDTACFKVEAAPGVYDIVVEIGARSILVPAVEIG